MNLKPVLSVVKTAAKLVLSAPVLAAVLIALALHFGALLVESLTGGPEVVPVRHARSVQRAERAQGTEKWLEVMVPCPPSGLPVQRPPMSEREALAERLDRKDLVEVAESPAGEGGMGVFQPNRDTVIFNREVIGTFDVPKMPEGGKAHFTYDRKENRFDVDYEINEWIEQVAAVPKKKKYEFPKLWGFGVAVEQNDLDDLWEWTKIDDQDVYFFIEPLRIGKMTSRLQGGVRTFMDKNPKYIRFALEYRSR